MNRETYQTIRTAGPQQGTFIGIMWIISFVCIAHSLTMPFLSLLGFGIGIGSLLSAVILSYQFRWRNCKGTLSFGGQWLQTLQLYMYASILMTMGVFLYMQFIDRGSFGEMYQQIMETPENKLLLERMLEGSGQTADDMIAQIAAITPINLALNIMTTNMIVGMMISLPTALLARIRVGSKLEKMI